MKIYINRQPKHGPWGGGAKTVNKLVELLLHKGHTVVYELQEGIDVIFCMDPRPNHRGEWYQHFLDYRFENKNTKIVQRVGDVGTHSKPHLTDMVRQTLPHSDHFIFPSKWAKEWIGFESENFDIINNAPMQIFYENRKLDLKLSEQVSIVTHHWSTNPKKGFDIYQKFEEWCKDQNISFHYIGQVPPGVSFGNYTKPISAEQLSVVLPKYDIYLTASQEEAGANHVLEALAAGLPVVYRDTGGSINNYCHPYGEEYSTFDGMVDKVQKVIGHYDTYKSEVLKYVDNNDNVIEKYCDIIEKI